MSTETQQPEEPAYRVLPYQEDTLAFALSNKFNSSEDVRLMKGYHYHYFLDYFGKDKGALQAQTIVIETEYLSNSYLQDFSSFYSTCFEEYDKICKRVHFFGEAFSTKDFEGMIGRPSARHKKKWESYLGYIAVRPLPKAIIGATLLKTYDCGDTGRYYPGTREYTIHVFGKELKLKTLVFQQQDAVVGACASSALWTTFHQVSTSRFFQTKLPSPSEITKSVKTFAEGNGRRIPNKGLSISQICEAIDELNLMPELFMDIDNTVRDYTSIEWAKRLVYAYNKTGIPVLLGINIIGRGKHLVAVTGYKLETRKIKRKSKEPELLSERIEKFYAHDDQVGPFARFIINKGRGAKDMQLITPWTDDEDKLIPAHIECICIPLSEQIRLPYIAVYEKVLKLDYLLNWLTNTKFVWDIFLNFSSDYKQEIFEDRLFSQRIRKKMLEKPMPKFIWQARVRTMQEELIADFIFDATNIIDSHFCMTVNLLDENIRVGFANTYWIEETNLQWFIQEELGYNYAIVFKKEIEDIMQTSHP